MHVSAINVKLTKSYTLAINPVEGTVCLLGEGRTIGLSQEQAGLMYASLERFLPRARAYPAGYKPHEGDFEGWHEGAQERAACSVLQYHLGKWVPVLWMGTAEAYTSILDGCYSQGEDLQRKSTYWRKY